jgi:hypothetical protein
MRTGLGHDDLVAAGAFMTAANFASDELLDVIAARIGW